MFDFDIKELPNFKFSLQELKDYYAKVSQYDNLKWQPNSTNTLDHKVNGVYSWAIQSNLKDATKPCPPYDIKHDTEVLGTFDNPTELVFGFGKYIVDAIPDIRQTVISAHPPGTVIQQHIDNTEFVKVHIPIQTNNQSYFVFGDSKYNLQEGKAYLINTTNQHGTINQGDTDRIHLIFKIPVDNVDELLNAEWILDPSQINFDCKKIENIKFNFSELEDYYDDLVDNFDYLKWTMPEVPGTNLKGLYGYAILTNCENVDERPLPPGMRKDKKAFDPIIKPTKMLKGFAKKLYDQIPYIEELVITGHPENSGIPPHADKDEHVRVHIPLYANNDSHFIINEHPYVLEPNNVYIVNTKRIHTTINKGSTDRIHLHFKIPIGKINIFLRTQINV
jgi:hypothetical protein